VSDVLTKYFFFKQKESADFQTIVTNDVSLGVSSAQCKALWDVFTNHIIIIISDVIITVVVDERRATTQQLRRQKSSECDCTVVPHSQTASNNVTGIKYMS